MNFTTDLPADAHRVLDGAKVAVDATNRVEKRGAILGGDAHTQARELVENAGERRRLARQ